MTIVGTPSYMAPECWDGIFSPQSDLWAVGVMLYQWLTGRPAFAQTELGQLMLAIVTKRPDPFPASIPQRLASIVNLSLERDRTKRYRRADIMVSDLRAFLTAFRAQEPIGKPPKQPQVHPAGL